MIEKSKINIGITTIIYNNYGRFLPQWVNAINQLKVRPTQVTIVLGKNHGIPPAILWPVGVKVIETEEEGLGKLKNIAMENTPTEWVMGLSVDDQILPWALDEFEKCLDSDIIVCAYLRLDNKSLCMHPRITKEILLSKRQYLTGKNFMHGGIPFKRWLWEKHHYHESDCFNSMFWIDCATENPVFSSTPVPCLLYNKWEGSHSDAGKEVRQKRFEIINEYRLSKIK